MTTPRLHTLIIVATAVAVAGCGITDPYTRRAVPSSTHAVHATRRA